MKIKEELMENNDNFAANAIIRGGKMERIVINKNIRHGKPVIRGTRVPIDIMLGSLAGGMSFKEICEDYDIIEEDIRAAIEYAAKLGANEEIHILEAV